MTALEKPEHAVSVVGGYRTTRTVVVGRRNERLIWIRRSIVRHDFTLRVPSKLTFSIFGLLVFETSPQMSCPIVPARSRHRCVLMNIVFVLCALSPALTLAGIAGWPFRMPFIGEVLKNQTAQQSPNHPGPAISDLPRPKLIKGDVFGLSTLDLSRMADLSSC
jgi:hypothetical protein